MVLQQKSMPISAKKANKMYQVSLFLFYVANKIEQPVQTLEAMASRRSPAAQYSRISCLFLELMYRGGVATAGRQCLLSYSILLYPLT